MTKQRYNCWVLFWALCAMLLSAGVAANSETTTSVDNTQSEIIFSYAVGYRVGEDLADEINETENAPSIEAFIAGIDTFLMDRPMQQATLEGDEAIATAYQNGYQLAQILSAQGLPITNSQATIDAFIQGRNDGLATENSLYSEATITEAIETIANQQMEAVMIANEQAEAEGIAFLAENRNAEEVQTTDSGLQYRVIRQGEGNQPTVNDEVVVHYEGRLIDGTVFDSSYQRGQTISFPVSGVISGWTEALTMMPVGSEWELFIPAELAYGQNSPDPSLIPNNAVLIFKVELIDIN